MNNRSNDDDPASATSCTRRAFSVNIRRMDNPKLAKRLTEAVAGKETPFNNAVKSLHTLLSIVSDLRGQGGCPWDAEQSLASLRQYIREEADEVCEALDNILEFEDELRLKHGIDPANPDQPSGPDRARTEKKGLTIAHHPHRVDFHPANSASGAPLPDGLSDDEKQQLSRLYSDMQDELGDFMLQGAFLGDILLAMGRGGVETSLELIAEKLIRRHPHVYGDCEVADSAEVLTNWEAIKRDERNK